MRDPSRVIPYRSMAPKIHALAIVCGAEPERFVVEPFPGTFVWFCKRRVLTRTTANQVCEEHCPCRSVISRIIQIHAFADLDVDLQSSE